MFTWEQRGAYHRRPGPCQSLPRQGSFCRIHLIQPAALLPFNLIQLSGFWPPEVRYQIATTKSKSQFADAHPCHSSVKPSAGMDEFPRDRID